MDPWTLTATEPRAELLYVANGYMSTVLNWDGGTLFESPACPCYVRGVYDRTGPGSIDRLAVLPCWSRLRYGAPTKLRHYERRLDLRHGLVHTCFALEETRGIVHLEQTLFASRADPNLAALCLAIRPEFDGDITILGGVEALGGGDFETLELGAEDGMIWLRLRSLAYGIEIMEAVSFQAPGWTCSESVGQTQVASALVTSGKAGQETTLAQMVRLVTTLESPNLALGHPPGVEGSREGTTPRGYPGLPLQIRPRGELVGALTPDYGRAKNDHERAWSRLWETDIEIEGDPEIQQFARAALFYLWSTVCGGDRWSIAPMGLSSNAYNGHIFWDAELWMYPSLLVTQPDMARSCVAYREQTLGPARARATSNGYRGAQFPWEGGYSGEEMTPPWWDTRDFQLHITADVAIAQWWYFINTQDVDWLRDHGFPVIRECAEFWASRVEYNAEHDRYEISDVVCADEYAAHVDNDAFTNAAVRIALLIGERAAQILGESAPADWRTIADKMYVPYDGERRIHLEFDGYDGQVTKQADVELLAFPLEYTIDPEQVARDLEFYGAVIDPNGPALSYSVYSILSAQLGREDAAYDYLRRSFVPNTRLPFWSFSETPTNNEFFFCTGAGGALQALLFGFTGLRLREGHFVLAPLLPRSWKALRLRNLYLLGARTDIEIEPGRAVVRRRLADGKAAIHICRMDGASFVAVDWQGDLGTKLVLELQDGVGRGRSQTVKPGERTPLSDTFESGIRLRLTRSSGDTVMDVLLARTP
jgi:trehalose/maltose hydrolase-like predicted phosphorylase